MIFIKLGVRLLKKKSALKCEKFRLIYYWTSVIRIVKFGEWKRNTNKLKFELWMWEQ